jgi:hypothetical protein
MKPPIFSKYGIMDIDIIVLIIFVLIGLVLSFSLQQHVIASKLTCNSFLTHDLAQEVFDRDHIKYKSLDRDQDGVACENLP